MKLKRNLIIVLALILLFAVIFIVFTPITEFQVFKQCEEQEMGISCVTTDNCIQYYKNLGAPQDWLNKQIITCRDSKCYITPDYCGEGQYVQK